MRDAGGEEGVGGGWIEWNRAIECGDCIFESADGEIGLAEIVSVGRILRIRRDGLLEQRQHFVSSAGLQH